MSLDARFELRIDGGLVMEIRVHPKTAADAVADMLEDAAASIREGIETMMDPIHSEAGAADQDDTAEPPPIEWRYSKGNPDTTAKPTTRKLLYLPTRLSTFSTTH